MTMTRFDLPFESFLPIQVVVNIIGVDKLNKFLSHNSSFTVESCCNHGSRSNMYSSDGRFQLPATHCKNLAIDIETCIVRVTEQSKYRMP